MFLHHYTTHAFLALKDARLHEECRHLHLSAIWQGLVGGKEGEFLNDTCHDEIGLCTRNAHINLSPLATVLFWG